MSARTSLWFSAAGILILLAFANPADARKRHNDDWGDRLENRRDARRTGIVVGALTTAAVSASASNEAQQRYEECNLDTGYDEACARLRYEDERRARQSARRAGVLAGATARAIVRD